MRVGKLLPAIAVLSLLPCSALAEEKQPPTPAERVAELKADLAEEHAKLGTWAAGKKLLRYAYAHFVIAVRLDPDCRRARQRLGHRRNKAGEWEPGREKDWADGRGAMDRHGEDFRAREADLLEEEVRRFEALGVELVKEGHHDLGRPLLLRTHLLQRRREAAAKALGLERLPNGFATPEIASGVRSHPSPDNPGIEGTLQRVMGVRTLTVRCHSVIAETVGNRTAAERLAVATHRAQHLTAMRFGVSSRGIGWLLVFVARGKEQWDSFIDRCQFPPNMADAAKQIGSLRVFQPRHMMGGWVPPGTDAVNRAPNFVHMAAEHVLWQSFSMKVPAWITEAAGVDACLDLLGVPGAPCVVVEESVGIRWKDAFESVDTWGQLVLRRAASGELPRLGVLLRAQIQALSLEDIIAGHAYYRYFLREQLQPLRGFLTKIREGEEPEPAFESAFGAEPEEIEARFLSLILGG
jgi:hypothetical protein